jgi:hypothetical protein
MHEGSGKILAIRDNPFAGKTGVRRPSAHGFVEGAGDFGVLNKGSLVWYDDLLKDGDFRCELRNFVKLNFFFLLKIVVYRLGCIPFRRFRVRPGHRQWSGQFDPVWQR